MISARKILKMAFFSALSLIAVAMLAELIACFFLPKPTVHKLPMVKFIADPACGYRLSPNQKAYTLGSLATVNSWGFRGKNWTLEKPKNTIRIAVLGSSYAFGHGVGDTETYSAQLESMLNQNKASKSMPYEVMSFGLGGYDTGHELNVLKTYALNFKPDIVILSFFFNDFFYIRDYGFYAKMFQEQDATFSRAKWEIRNFMRHSRLAMWLWDEFKDVQGAYEPGEVSSAMDAYIRKGIAPSEGPQAESWKLITERIREFKALSQTYGFRPILMIIPTHQEMLEKDLNVSYVKHLKLLGDDLHMPPLIVLDGLKKTGRDLNYYLIPYDFHLSPRGHQFIASLLEKEILHQ